VDSIVGNYLTGALTHAQAAALYLERFQTSAPIDRLREILTVASDPLPNLALRAGSSARRKTQQWAPIEDTRLFAAVHKFGTENWSHIAQFIGNGRTRSQCSQRWQRGLDPRISRNRWSAEEEAMLLRLVATHGEKSWIRISTALGNRSDVQCRYRFHQIQKGRTGDDAATASDDAAPELPETVPEPAPVEKEETPPPPATEWLAEPLTLQRVGLELGANSMSEIFWLLHQ
jgi:hypothetical protein